MHEKYGQDLAHVLPVYKSAEKFPVLLLVPILRDLHIFLKPVLRVGKEVGNGVGKGVIAGKVLALSSPL